MITIRRAEDRGHANHGWLDTHHSFSFANYYDPNHMGFRALRVINEDRVEGETGFGTHSHRDMEIVTYVLEGELHHRDSMGTNGVIYPGEVQRMSAGTGVTHSEMNPSTSRTHFLQIWILPEKSGIAPSYEQKAFSDEERAGKLRLIVSPGGEQDSLHIHQDAKIYSTLLEKGAEVEHSLEPGRHAWLQVAKGRLDLNGVELKAGDGAAVSEESLLKIAALEPSEALLFDLA